MTLMPGSVHRMEEAMSPLSDIQRFTRAERWTHRTLAVLMLALIITGAVLFIPDLSALVGNRPLVKNVHTFFGVILPIPLIIAAFFVAFRRDAQLLNRFTPDDWRWLRSRTRRSGDIPVGKFNAGQKLNAAFTLGAVIVMWATGFMLWQNGYFTDDVRTGATFVHDWLALAVTIVVIGHTWMAFNDAEARRGMRTGMVSPEWAELHHSTWANDLPRTLEVDQR